VVELARKMVMERTTLVRALRPLQDAGLVLSEIVRPGRALELSASPAGLRKIAEVLPLWEAAQKEFETTFGRGRAIRLRNDILEIARRKGLSLGRQRFEAQFSVDLDSVTTHRRFLWCNHEIRECKIEEPP
jgi:DNA-binding transcriptional ArsR family regulator